jgi:hypothetical protein
MSSIIAYHRVGYKKLWKEHDALFENAEKLNPDDIICSRRKIDKLIQINPLVIKHI